MLPISNVLFMYIILTNKKIFENRTNILLMKVLEK